MDIILIFRKLKSKPQLNVILFFILIDLHFTTSQEGRCNKNQACIKVQDCPFTKKTLEDLRTTNDAKEKEKLIASIKSLICGSSIDRTVCCDIDNNGSTQLSEHSLNDSNLNPPVQCGVGPVSRGHTLGFRFVSDGSDAKIIDYPWMVSLGSFKGQNDYTHICGGSLISSKYVLTAAHCFDDPHDYRNLTMLFGIDNLNNPSSSNDYFERDIKRIHIHEDYTSPESYFDVALAEANEPEIMFDIKTWPVCLPKFATRDVNLRVNHGLVLAGWGSMKKDGNTSAKLQHTRVLVENQILCNNKYKTDDFALELQFELVLPNLIEPNLICGASEFGSGSCSGDSGGPLVFNDKLSNPPHYVQVGIVQGGAGECGNDRFPGLYARLDNHDVLSFIRKTAFGENTGFSILSEGSDDEYQDEEYDHYDNGDNQVCKTISGSKKNQECQFPFTFQETNYTTCITGRERQQPWCPTELDNNGSYIRGKWGYCDTVNCPLADFKAFHWNNLDNENECCMVGGSICTKDGSKCPFDYNRILVAGEESKPEIVIVNNSPNQNCNLKGDFPPHRHYNKLAYGVLEGVPMICGGDKGYDVHQECVAIGHSDLKIQMLEKRSWTSGIVLNYPKKTLWITGGLSEVNAGKGQSTSEFIYLDKPAEKGPDLPFEIHKHCMIKYNDSAIFFIGGDLDEYGGSQSSTTWIIDPTNNFTIRNGPALPERKGVMACGKMTIDSKIWFVVGPYELGTQASHLDLLDPSNVNQGWLKGPKIPCSSGNNFGGTFVPTTQGLLYTGGYDCSKNLYELRGDSIQSLKWFKLNETLSSNQGWYPAAYPLPIDLEVTCT